MIYQRKVVDLEPRCHGARYRRGLRRRGIDVNLPRRLVTLGGQSFGYEESYRVLVKSGS